MKSRFYTKRPQHSFPVIVIGMHRSGTSLVTRQLHALGIHMGQDLTVNAESRCFQELNRSMLREGGGSWSDISPVLDRMQSSEHVRRWAVELEEKLFWKNGMGSFWSVRQKMLLSVGLGPRHWGWKDPRNSVTLPVWLTVFPQAKVIHVIRNGIDAAISLHRREARRSDSNRDYSPECKEFTYCFQLWEQYIQACREHTRLLSASHYVEVHYEELLHAPGEQLRMVLSFLNYEAHDTKLHRVAGTVDRSRLANDEYRQQYSSEIAGLQPSPLMMELGYV